MRKLSPLKAQEVSRLFDHALSLLQGGDAETAIPAFETANQLAPGQVDILHMLGVARFTAGKTAEAITVLKRAQSLRPADAMIWMSLGLAHYLHGSFKDAQESLRKADRLQPGDLRITYNLANALADGGKTQESIKTYEKALEIDPKNADVLHALTNTLRNAGAYKAAVRHCKQLMLVQPDSLRIHGRLLHLKARACIWDDFAHDCARTLAEVDQGEDAAEPFDLLSFPSSPAQQLACARRYATTNFPFTANAQGPQLSYQHDRIRIGYFSADFHAHATAYLMAELFELHDRTRFEIFAFSFGPESQDSMRARLSQSIEHFIEVGGHSDAQIAALARKHEIDIAIDLKGYTTHSRTGIFAHRAAPVQVNYLGYPGSMGASFVDYIIADHTLIPASHEAAYNEKVVRMPCCYQPNDRRRPISAPPPNRAESGLPVGAFVFCCFNNSFKITPDVFAIWMRLLLNTPNSVLWLLEDNRDATEQLQASAGQHGIDPQRLIFAPRLPLAEHLARHHHADLFVDTFHYNAHTTASDALWAGLPVVTYAGQTFASRVSASLLVACKLPDLVTDTPASYETLCLSLAHNPEQLAKLRARLGTQQSALPLFDTPAFTRHLEKSFELMLTQHLAGLRPDHITLSA